MQTWTEKIDLGNGIKCYRNIIKPEFDVIGRLESNLKPIGDNTGYSWQPAYVGYKQLIPEYRDCADFKFKKSDIENDKSQVSLNLFCSRYGRTYMIPLFLPLKTTGLNTT